MKRTTINVITRTLPPGQEEVPGHWEVLPAVHELGKCFRATAVRVPPRHPYRLNPAIRDGLFYSRTIEIEGERPASYQINFFPFGLPSGVTPEEVAVIALELLPCGYFDLNSYYIDSDQREYFHIDPSRSVGCVLRDEETYFLVHDMALNRNVLLPVMSAIGEESERVNDGDGSLVFYGKFSNSDDQGPAGRLYNALLLYLYELKEHEDWWGMLEGYRKARDERDGEIFHIGKTLLRAIREECRERLP